MRIAIEAQRIFRKNKHGMDFVALELIKELQKIDKVNEYFILVAPGEDRSVLTQSENFRIIEINCNFYPLWEQIALPLAIKKIKPDVLHCTGNTAPIIGKTPLLLTLHDVIFLEKRVSGNKSLYQNLGWYYRRLIVPMVLKKCRKIITVSESEALKIKSLPQMSKKEVIPVYNSVGSHFKIQESSSQIKKIYTDSSDYIFFLGNTDPKKNTIGVFKAYSIYLKKSEEKLPLLVADLSENYIKTILKREKLEDIENKIIPAGYIPNNHLPHVYSGASFFLYPSLRESFGIPQLEAMACGTPVIASNKSAMPEICSGAALLVDPLNIESIADAMIDMENPEIREEYVARGLERVGFFSWEKSAQKLSAIYRSMEK